jgi:hypothetical protein
VKTGSSENLGKPMRKSMISAWRLHLWMICVGLTACTSADLNIECRVDADCSAGQECRYRNCVYTGVGENGCLITEIRCGDVCADPTGDLRFCGGCGGCASNPGTRAVACEDALCRYECEPGYIDANADLTEPDTNGCECPVEPGPERCDGIDNDCDGQLDEPEAAQACQSRANARPVGCVDRTCVYACEAAFADSDGDLGDPLGNGCECSVLPEVCDGVDNDCDGAVDADDSDFRLGCPALVGAEVTGCTDGTCIYVCSEGAEDRNDDLGQVSSDGCECVTGTFGPEVCDGIDNDCDGLVDQNDDDYAQLCTAQAGVCSGAPAPCADGRAAACAPRDYSAHAPAYEPGAETLCDELDNNCDGSTDENCCGEPDASPYAEAMTDRELRADAQRLATANDPTLAHQLVVITTAEGEIWAAVHDARGNSVAPSIVVATAEPGVLVGASWVDEKFLVAWAHGDTLIVGGITPLGRVTAPFAVRTELPTSVSPGASPGARLVMATAGNDRAIVAAPTAHGSVTIAMINNDGTAAHIASPALTQDQESSPVVPTAALYDQSEVWLTGDLLTAGEDATFVWHGTDSLQELGKVLLPRAPQVSGAALMPAQPRPLLIRADSLDDQGAITAITLGAENDETLTPGPAQALTTGPPNLHLASVTPLGDDQIGLAHYVQTGQGDLAVTVVITALGEPPVVTALHDDDVITAVPLVARHELGFSITCNARAPAARARPRISILNLEADLMCPNP